MTERTHGARERRGPGPVERITREGGIGLHRENGGETLAWRYRRDHGPPEEIGGEPVEEPADPLSGNGGGH